MAVRPIDAVQVLHNINLHHIPIPTSKFDFGFNYGLNQAIWEITHVPTLTQPNEPLTLEELREMSGQPFWDGAGSVWWIVAHVEGSKIYTEEGAILDFYEEGEEDVYFRRPPEGGNDVR